MTKNIFELLLIVVVLAFIASQTGTILNTDINRTIGHSELTTYYQPSELWSMVS